MSHQLQIDKALGWVYSRFGHVRERRGGSEITVPTPFPKKGGGQANQQKEQLWINLEKDVWHCWASGRKGNFASLVSLIESKPREIALARFYEQEIASNESLQSAISKFVPGAVRVEDSPINIELPPYCEHLQPGGDALRQRCWSYLISRGLPEEEAAKLMYCYDGEYRGYIIIPFYDRKGGLMYWQGRAIDAQRGAKYIGPPKEIAQKRNIIYTNDWDMSDHPVFIVEGFFDAKALDIIGIHAAAVLGSLITPGQANLLAGAGCDEAVVATDMDGAGQYAVSDFRKALSDAGIKRVFRVCPYVGDDWWALYEQADKTDIDAVRNRILSSVKEWSAKNAFVDRLSNTLSGSPETPSGERARRPKINTDDIRSIAKKIRAS